MKIVSTGVAKQKLPKCGSREEQPAKQTQLVSEASLPFSYSCCCELDKEDGCLSIQWWLKQSILGNENIALARHRFNTTPGYLLVKKINWLFSNSEKCLMANNNVLNVDANMTALWEEQQLTTHCFRPRTALDAATTVVVVLRDEDQRDRAEADKLLVIAKEANNLLSLNETEILRN
ncbi:Hypothetical predicted protein [Cloeon dipterum]|uniref:Uncharacterized protein n=1 Tax=Cloeon dipterum TaxID=197152 RepID=A0A8S1DP45_9INSE|nr:Hypothetical predicted protein [Cloeon dipterum]